MDKLIKGLMMEAKYKDNSRICERKGGRHHSFALSHQLYQRLLQAFLYLLF